MDGIRCGFCDSMKIISYKLGPSEIMGDTDRGSKERADSEAARELADVNLDWACPDSLGLSLGSQVLVPIHFLGVIKLLDWPIFPNSLYAHCGQGSACRRGILVLYLLTNIAYTPFCRTLWPIDRRSALY